MRKVARSAALIFTAVCAAALILLLAALPDRLVFKGGKSYSFFVGDTSKNCRVVTCSAESAAVERLTLKDVCGESADYPELDVDEFLKSVNGEILFCEELSDSVNYYCSADLPYSVELYGRTVNLHICVKDGGVTVASPIIFGGY